MDWTYLNGQTDTNAASVEFSVDIPADPHGYPFRVALRATFRLSDRELQVTLTGLKRGERTAPFGCGWHPYLRPPGGDIDGCRLRVPAAQAVATDDSLLPLHGARPFSPLDAEPVLDLRTAPALHGLHLDRCYTQLAADADGWVRSHLLDPGVGLGLTLAQERGVVHVYTGDTLPERQCASMAIGPTEFIPRRLQPSGAYHRHSAHAWRAASFPIRHQRGVDPIATSRQFRR